MEKLTKQARVIPLKEQELYKIEGGWLKRVVFFILDNWADIKEGLKDGADSYRSR